MSTTKIALKAQQTHCIANLRKGGYNWTIKVRVIRIWKNVTTAGAFVQGLNLLFLDDKNARIHCYIPDECEEKYEPLLSLGSIYLISNFLVKDYRENDRFICIRSDKQIKFTNYTKIKEIVEESSLIQLNAYGFYEIGDIKEIENQQRYCIDVIGVIEEYQPLRRYLNRGGRPTRDSRFNLTDGRSSVSVTFWEDFAQRFSEAIDETEVRPIILIVASAKVMSFKGQPMLIDYAATRYYINEEHHSVFELRQRFSEPSFTQRHMCRQSVVMDKFFCVQELKNLSKQYTGRQVFSRSTIKKVESENSWFYLECTSCQEEVEYNKDFCSCNICNRMVPYPDKKYRLFTICADKSGGIGVLLGDHEVRVLSGKMVSDYIGFHLQNPDTVPCPDELKELVNKDVTLLLVVTDANVLKKSNIFTATDVVEGHTFCLSEINSPVSTQMTFGSSSQSQAVQSSNATIQLDALTDLNLQSPTTTDTLQSSYKKKGKRCWKQSAQILVCTK